MENVEPSDVPGGDDAVTLENSLAGPQKVKHRVTTWPSNSMPKYLPKRNDNMCLHTYLYRNVHSSVICNNPNMEATQISITR